MNETSSVWATLGKMIAKICLGFLFSLYGGWVIMLMWGWFAVGILHLTPVTLMMAVAMRMIVGIFRMEAGNIKMALQLDKVAKLESMQESLLDWCGQPFLDTMILIGGAMWHFVFFPIMVAMGL